MPLKARRAEFRLGEGSTFGDPPKLHKRKGTTPRIGVIISAADRGVVMKNLRLVWTVLLFLFLLTTLAIAQNSQSGPNAASGESSGSSINDPELETSILMSGKVEVDDGTPLPAPAAIRTVCKEQKRLVTYTDAKGAFSFTLGASSARDGVFDASMSATGGSPFGNTPSPLHNQREWRWCGIQADLPGFSSEVVELTSRTDSFHAGNIGSLVLHRINSVAGITVSATSAAAPNAAQKALEKGLEQEKDKQWDAAQDSLPKAVQIYPKYAVAWFELGRVQTEKKDVADAKKSFAQSLAADSHYVNPYLGLTQIAAFEQNWHELADLTSKVTALSPASSPQIWFYNSVANYNLNNLAEAEKSAREGIRIDREHHLPRLEHMLATVLMGEHDYAGANEHMQNYLRLASSPAETAEAQNGLAEIAKHLLPATAAAGGEKK